MANAFQKEGPVITPETAEKPARSEREIWAETLNESPVVRVIQFIVAAAILQFYGVVSPLWGNDAFDSFKSSFCILCITISLIIIYWQACGNDYGKNKSFTVSAGAILVHLGIIVLLCRNVGAFPAGLPLDKIALPYIMAPLLVTVLLGPQLGTFAALAVSMLGVFYVSADIVNQAHYLVTSLVTGMLTVYVTRDVRNRGQLLKAGALVGLLVMVMTCLMGVVNFEQSYETSSLVIILSFSVSFVLAILIGGMLPAIESFFKIITPISWLELTDMNHKLLKRLQLEAPGTFHHSIVVAQLAEAAAEAIGANGNYCRVVSYFHDIGKVKHPQFFIENLVEGESNPHDELTPSMSARIIIGHVADGVELAKENKLNRPIMDAIQQHHGTSLAYFFYRKAMEYRKEMLERVETGLAKLDDVPEVVESNFRYSGPVPQNREVGIVSLSDIVESATRSLHKPTFDELAAMVDNVIKGRIVDGHLDESGLTFGDIRKVRNSFISTLKNMRHARVSYPKDEEKEEPKVADDKADKAVKEKSKPDAGEQKQASPEPVVEESADDKALSEENKKKAAHPQDDLVVAESIDEA